MARRLGLVSDLQDRIVSKRKTSENLSLSTRRSSCSYEAPLKLNDIPRNTSELLKRYGNPRVKIPSYKLDAATLISLVIQKSLKRIFLQIKALRKLRNSAKNLKCYEKNEIFLIQNSKNPLKSSLPRACYTPSLIQRFKTLTEVIQKLKISLLFSGFEDIYTVCKKKAGAMGIGNIIRKIVEKDTRISIKLMKTAKLNNLSLRSGRVSPIPPLNLEKQFFSPYFPQNLRREGCDRSSLKVLYENSTNCSRKSFGLTDRRSEKPQNPSTLPSSIYSDSENSVTDRSDLKNTSKKRIQSIQLKDIDNFFAFDSRIECQKQRFKKSFFQEQEKIRKNYSKTLQKFAGNYELFTFEKILKQCIEKITIKAFYKWKFGVKKRRHNSSGFRLQNTKRFLNKIATLVSKHLLKSIFNEFMKNLSSRRQIIESCQNLVTNFEKDIKYRQKVCFSHWKSQSVNLYLEKLKILSFLQHLDYLIYMRKSRTLNTFKIINKKSFI